MQLTQIQNQIIENILSHIRRCGGQYNEWYVGISRDAKSRLFNDHKVSQTLDAWIFETARTHSEAREIENYFINVIGTDGGPGGGNSTARMVYAYKKAYLTNP